MIKKVLAVALVGVLGYMFFNAVPVKDFINNKIAKAKSVVKKQPVVKDDSVFVAPPAKINFPPINLSKPAGKQIRKLTLDLSRLVYVTGPIGSNGFMVANKITQLASQNNRPIYLILTSPGGSVIAGSAIISAMQAAKAPVYTVCYGMCASMAAMIHQYGTRRYVTDRTVIMFHPASASLGGNMDEIYNFTRAMIKYVAQIEVDVAKRIGWSFQDYKRYTNNELWINSDEAKTYNVADQIVYIRLNILPVFGSNTGEFLKRPKVKGITQGKDLIWIYKGNL